MMTEVRRYDAQIKGKTKYGALTRHESVVLATDYDILAARVQAVEESHER